MQFLKPNSISGEIMNLFDEAQEKVVIVSPYCKFDKWYKLVNKIENLKKRNIAIEVYIREGEKEANEQVLQIGLQPIPIANLHAKLYFNEKRAIITSMNLLLSSEISSIDVGYITETIKEYDEIKSFYDTYLGSKSREIKNNFVTNWKENLDKVLKSQFNNVRIFENEGSLNIRTASNNYDIFIWNNNRKNYLRFSGIVSSKEFDYASSIQQSLNSNDMEFDLKPADRGYNSIWATLQNPLVSENINFLVNEDANMVISSIATFISKIENIKEYCYQNRKIL